MSGFNLFDDSAPGPRPERAAHVSAASGAQPLTLTVHSLPTPQRLLTANARRTGRWKMLAVLLVCAAPVLASYFTYYVIRPEGRRNFGELINPQRPLPDLASVDLNGQASNLRALRGQWLLVSVAGGACAADCRQNLYWQRQLRESLGKDKDRLDLVWLIPDAAPVQTAPGAATVLRVPGAGLAAWLQPANGQALSDHLFLVDPMGNWMLRFPARLDLAGATRAKRDLERLLRAAASWDRAGRTLLPVVAP